MFSDLLHLENLSKSQVKRATSLSKKFNPNNKLHLEKAHTLLFDLFCANQLEGVHICLNVMTQLKFNGNFNLWVFIEPSYCLKYFLTDDDAIKTEMTKMLHHDITSKWEDEDEHKENIQNILDGNEVQSAQEQLSRYIDDDIKHEFHWRVNLLIKYLHIFALGATGKLSKCMVLNEINTHITRLRYIYKQIEN